MTPMEFLTLSGETITLILAFAIFAWLMKKFAWGPLLRVIDERQKRVEQGFEEIRLKQAEAGQLQRQYDERLKGIEDEARARIQEAVAEGRRIAAEINERAREDATQITERAKRNIELEIAKARLELRDEIVTMTLQASERLLRERLDDAGHRRLVGSFIDDLERPSSS